MALATAPLLPPPRIPAPPAMARYTHPRNHRESHDGLLCRGASSGPCAPAPTATLVLVQFNGDPTIYWAAMAMLIHAPAPAVLVQVPFPLYHSCSSTGRPRGSPFSSVSSDPIPPPERLLLVPPSSTKTSRWRSADCSSSSRTPRRKQQLHHTTMALRVSLSSASFTIPMAISLCSAAASMGSSMRNAGMGRRGLAAADSKRASV